MNPRSLATALHATALVGAGGGWTLLLTRWAPPLLCAGLIFASLVPAILAGRVYQGEF